MRQAVITGCIVIIAVLGGAIAFERHKGEQTPVPPDESRNVAIAPETSAPEGLNPEPPDTEASASANEEPSGWTCAIEAAMRRSRTPKPLSGAVTKGLAYLIGQQHDDGGWGQGGGWRQADQGGGRVEGADVADPSDVGNTCIATLALLRAGHTPKEGKYAQNVARAIAFICKNIEKADGDSLYVTQVRNTQLQSKIGTYIDTFLASLVLAETKDAMPDQKSEQRLVAALDRTIHKIEHNQKGDGTWAGEGWATVISQGVCTKALNRAKQAGVNVNDATLAKAEEVAKNNLGAPTGALGGTVVLRGAATGREVASSRPAAGMMGGAGMAPGDAGVPLYRSSQVVGGLQDSVNTNRQQAGAAKKVAEDPSQPEAKRGEARRQLKRFDEAEEALAKQTGELAGQLDNANFTAGFGSNGGEEFLSYMSISEALLVKGGKAWEQWDKKMTAGLTRAQDNDGGWSGQHCITGKTFCTAAALLVLTADRAPIPVATKMQEAK
jgi:hypothetical protein